MTVATLNKNQLPDDLSHEEVVTIKDSDPTLLNLEATIDGLVEELEAWNQAWACSLFILDLERLHFSESLHL